jgi:hypothetical protein
MKKTYEMNISQIDYNIDNNNQNSEIYHKINEDPFIPSEVDGYLKVNKLYNNLIFN